MKRIGILTSGGDCQGLNAAIRGVCKTLYNHYKKDEIEIYGIIDGYRGLITGEYRLMKPEDFSGILTRGGTILGTSRQPFKLMRVIDEENNVDKVAAMKANYKKMKLDCLVILGGNGTQKSANMLSQEGLNVVSLPKTIDNDLWGTDMTFGFQSAVDIATQVIDCIHTTATSHSRVFIVELMGHKAGWLTLYAGIAGGADVILIPEIPYDINKAVDKINERRAKGKEFSIVVVAEGAAPKGGEITVEGTRDNGAGVDNNKLGGVGQVVARQLEKLTGLEARNTTLGYMQRGGTPTAFDRVLSTKYGAKAMELALNGQFGVLAVLKNGKLDSVSLEDVVGRNTKIGAVSGNTAESNLRKVTMDDDLVKTARSVGINLGD